MKLGTNTHTQKPASSTQKPVTAYSGPPQGPLSASSAPQSGPLKAPADTKTAPTTQMPPVTVNLTLKQAHPKQSDETNKPTGSAANLIPKAELDAVYTEATQTGAPSTSAPHTGAPPTVAPQTDSRANNSTIGTTVVTNAGLAASGPAPHPSSIVFHLSDIVASTPPAMSLDKNSLITHKATNQTSNAQAMEIENSNKRSRAEMASWSEETSPSRTVKSKHSRLTSPEHAISAVAVESENYHENSPIGSSDHQPWIEVGDTTRGARCQNATQLSQHLHASNPSKHELTLYMKGTNGSDILSNTSKIWALLRAIDPRLSAHQVTKTKHYLRIDCVDMHQANIIAKVDRLGTLDVVTSPNRPQEANDGPSPMHEVIIFGVHENISLDEIMFDTKASAARRLPSPRSNPNLISRSVILTFHSAPPDLVEIGFEAFRTQLFVPRTVRCFRCQKFGHVSKYCKGQIRCPICAGNHEYANCSQLSHPAENRSKNCVNCGEAHSAAFRECPALKTARQITYIKTAEKISYAQAARKLASCGPQPTTAMQRTDFPVLSRTSVLPSSMLHTHSSLSGTPTPQVHPNSLFPSIHPPLLIHPNNIRHSIPPRTTQTPSWSSALCPTQQQSNHQVFWHVDDQKPDYANTQNCTPSQSTDIPPQSTDCANYQNCFPPQSTDVHYATTHSAPAVNSNLPEHAARSHSDAPGLVPAPPTLPLTSMPTALPNDLAPNTLSHEPIVPRLICPTVAPAADPSRFPQHDVGFAHQQQAVHIHNAPHHQENLRGLVDSLPSQDAHSLLLKIIEWLLLRRYPGVTLIDLDKAIASLIIGHSPTSHHEGHIYQNSN